MHTVSYEIPLKQTGITGIPVLQVREDVNGLFF